MCWGRPGPGAAQSSLELTTSYLEELQERGENERALLEEDSLGGEKEDLGLLDGAALLGLWSAQRSAASGDV